MDDNITKNEFYIYFNKLLNLNCDNEVREFLNTEFWHLKDKDGLTILHKACYLEMINIVRIIIEILFFKKKESFAKEYINTMSLMGYTALHFASYRGHIDLIKLLIEHGANHEIQNNKGLSVLHIAAQGDMLESIIYFKIKFDMSFDVRDKEGSTPLHWACYSGSERVVGYLLTHSININSRDDSGMTPLHLAVFSGNFL
jgi:ankyrin repeat protein